MQCSLKHIAISLGGVYVLQRNLIQRIHEADDTRIRVKSISHKNIMLMLAIT